MSSFDLYGLGAALLDTEMQVSDADLQQLNVEKGVMTLVDEQRQSDLLDAFSAHLQGAVLASGGSAANSIIAASYFGSRCFMSCRVADDEHGAIYLNDLRNAGVAYKSDNGSAAGTTGKCLVMITPDAERSMNTFLGISETFSEADLDLEALSASRCIYIEGYLVTSATGRPAAIRARQEAQAAGVQVSMSLSDPAIVEFFGDGLKEIIGAEPIDILFSNAAEALAFTGESDLEAACDALKRYSRRFIVTLGAEGALGFDGKTLHRVSGSACTPKDSNGAGDMFAGAFLHAYLKGRPFAEAIAFANRAAAEVVSQFGPRLRPEQHAQLVR